MQRQGSFAEAEYAGKKKQTRRDKFLAEMEQECRGPGWWHASPRSIRKASAVGRRSPWNACCGSILCSSGTGWPMKRSRTHSEPALGLDPGDSQALRGFAGIVLNRDPIPDATTVLHFRHWLERHDLTHGLFEEVSAMLEERGLLMRQGTIVDATIIAAPSSTKNKQQSRDPEMHQTRKGNQWYFGMK